MDSMYALYLGPIEQRCLVLFMASLPFVHNLYILYSCAVFLRCHISNFLSSCTSFRVSLRWFHKLLLDSEARIRPVSKSVPGLLAAPQERQTLEWSSCSPSSQSSEWNPGKVPALLLSLTKSSCSQKVTSKHQWNVQSIGIRNFTDVLFLAFLLLCTPHLKAQTITLQTNIATSRIQSYQILYHIESRRTKTGRETLPGWNGLHWLGQNTRINCHESQVSGTQSHRPNRKAKAFLPHTNCKPRLIRPHNSATTKLSHLQWQTPICKVSRNSWQDIKKTHEQLVQSCTNHEEPGTTCWHQIWIFESWRHAMADLLFACISIIEYNMPQHNMI